jgi:hypothetical protein
MTTYWSAGGRKDRESDASAINTRWTYNEFGQELTVVPWKCRWKYKATTTVTCTTSTQNFRWQAILVGGGGTVDTTAIIEEEGSGELSYV